ncbi:MULTISPECIES: ABC transporter ATP-binding protein [unclassified Isoptericola]|uniref:ABC transporter ATP-binding protein n=1 Tax=unclassified Isoptericola TaxID=2623355 RepID=UPI002712AF07|nr:MULTISPECIES: ABC transporter ATP-binding protein [unclassified Isoptericola]MDO8144861.1 ABC transporter ATP-binding protein [Isoptericola sp. 178]MDO8152575.1 ABC transporter ATP-binding protein [Isoptericola sp. b408]
MPPTARADRPASPSVPAGSDLSTLASLRRLLPTVRPALPRLVAGLVAALGASLAALAIPRVLQVLVEGPLAAGAAAGDPAALLWPTLAVLALGLLEAGLILLRRTLVMYPGTRVEAALRTTLFRHLLQLPAAFHDRWAGGQLLSRSMTDLGLLRRWLVFGLLQLVVSTITVVVGIAVLVATAGWLGLVYLVGAVPVVVIAYRFSRRYRVIARTSQDQSGDLANTVEESVHGIRVLKAFGRGGDALESFTGQAEQLRRTEIRKAGNQATVTTALHLIPEATLAVCLVLGVWSAAEGQLTVGALAAFFLTAAVINGPVVDLGMTLSMTLNARTAVDRFFEVVETANPLTDPAEPRELGTVRGDVTLRDVTFRHEADEPPVLDGVDLDLPAGTTTALVGLTGSGKSTLAMLLPRLHDVTTGSVRLDGIDVRDLRRHDLRRAVAVAFEEPTLFSTTVRENVLLGVDDSLPAPERERLLHSSLDVARAGFVHDLPQGVDTRIGEEGLSLSGGQRQRLALARAIAARPRVLVLDDPLSALDVTTEEAVTRGLREVLAGTTSLVIAHRPSTVALADRVAVLSGGRISAVGTHRELLARDPHYRYVVASLEEDWVAHEHETDVTQEAR